jgi:hypothetical protein
VTMPANSTPKEDKADELGEAWTMSDLPDHPFRSHHPRVSGFSWP